MSKHANLRLTAKLLTIIVPFMAKNDIRYYLNAINVRPHADGGAIICATNGHVLGAIHDRNAVCEHEVILRFDGRMQQACGAGLSGDRAVVMIGDRLAVVEKSGAEIYIQAGNPEVEANYPRYERVIPKEDTLQPGLIGMYGAQILSTCEKAASAAAKVGKSRTRSYSGMQFFTVNGDPNASAVCRLGAEKDFVGVLMPMRGDSPILAAPAWVAALPQVDDLANMTKTAAASKEDVKVPA
jgi:hypothetical protein